MTSEIHTNENSGADANHGHDERGHFYKPPRGESPIPRQREPQEDAEPKQLSRRKFLVGLGVAGGAAAVGVAYVMGIQSTKRESITTTVPNTPSPEAVSPAPSMSPSPEISESPAPTPEAPEKDDSELLEVYRNLPIEEFNQLPRSQRNKVIAYEYWRIRDGYVRHVPAFFGQQLIPGDPGKFLWDFNPLYNKPGSTKYLNGQQIVDQAFFAQQAVQAQYVDANHPNDLDRNHALQMLSGIYYYPDYSQHPELSPDNYYEFLEKDTREATRTGRLAEEDRPLATGTSHPYEGRDAEGNSAMFKDVTYVLGGHTYKEKFILESTTIRVTNNQTNKIEEITMEKWTGYGSQKLS